MDDAFRVMFINPLVSAEETYGKRFKRLGAVQPPLGMCYIAAVLEREGYNVRILDANCLGLLAPEVIPEIASFAPQLIGLYTTTMGSTRVTQIAQEIKQAFPGTPIVLGGPHLLGMGKDILKNSCFDYGVVGEGEMTALELVKGLEAGSDVTGTNGLILRKEGQVVQNPPREAIKDLDSLPFPARHLLPPLSQYHLKAMITKKHPATHIFTSRGCPYSCIFCTDPFGKKVRFHSPEYVVAEMEHLVKDHGIKEVTINDDTFNVNRKRVFEFCKLLKKKNLKITWSCLLRVNLVDKELLKEMKGAGCWLIQPGVESGNQKILDFIKKDITVEQVLNCSKWAREVGLMIKPSFIIGHPMETKVTVEDTIRLAQSMKAHYPAFALMTPFPATEMWEIADRYGTFDRSNLSRLVPSMNACFVPKGLTSEFLVKKQKEAFRRLYLDPAMVFRHVFAIRSFTDIRKMWWAFQGLMG